MPTLEFRFGVTAAHIRLAALMVAEVRNAVAKIQNERIRTYGLTKYLTLYLVGEVLRQESDGRALLAVPLPYLRTQKSLDDRRQLEVLEQIRRIATDVAVELDFYVQEKENETGGTYDYKSEFKSKSAVSAIRANALKEYSKAKHRGNACIFRLPT
jgi:hypothetical protein